MKCAVEERLHLHVLLVQDLQGAANTQPLSLGVTTVGRVVLSTLSTF